VPPRLAFVDPDKRVEVLHDDVPPAEVQAADAIVVLDTSAWKQLGAMAEVIQQSKVPLIVIDHHASRGEMVGLVLKDETAEATGRLVADFVAFVGQSMTRPMAEALFAAVATDTGWFRFPATQASTLTVAGQLIEAGALPWELYQNLYERDTFSRCKLRGRALDHLQLEPDGRLAHTFLLQQDFQETGVDLSETEDFINMALTVDGTQTAVMLTEQRPEVFKISFRSRDTTDCSRIAAQFRGGGHRAAAGATIEGPFEQVQSQVLAAVRQAMTAG